MNKDNAKDYLPLVQALADGKDIAFDGDEIEDPKFNAPASQYAIIEPPKPRPFNNEELKELFYDNVKLRCKNSGNDYAITSIHYENQAMVLGAAFLNTEELLNYFEIPPQPARPNGGLCGVVE